MLLPFPQNMQPNHANSSMTVQKAQQLRTWVICNTEPLDCCRVHLQRSFLATWNDQVGGVDPPTFDIGVWSLSQQTTESLPKTTNYVDGSQSFFFRAKDEYQSSSSLPTCFKTIKKSIRRGSVSAGMEPRKASGMWVGG